ncbi:hypothetical protein HID58_090528, partial [Brassica napus]
CIATALQLYSLCNLSSILTGLLETISIHLWANVEKFDSTIMTNSQLPLSQLKAVRSRTTVVRRLLYFWEARDVKKVIELMEIDIVLSDPGI